MLHAFEIGPIRPPSEAQSLLVRVTRNCPWNRCTFCPVYKGERFELRPAADVVVDVEAMGAVAARLREASWSLGLAGRVTGAVVREASRAADLPPGAGQVALFLAAGGKSAFLQDANSLVARADDVATVLEAVARAFPSVERVTSYARAHTIARKKLDDLARLRAAGLTRVHVGLESGSDRVLARVQKGADAATHVEAGRRAKAAGFELSEYVMPGLGGRALSRDHAVETARVLGAVDPHFIRLRTTALAPGTPLCDEAAAGAFERMTDEEVVAEIRLFLEHLDATSAIRSDHALNLFPEIDGQLPGDKDRLIAILDRFLALEPRLRQAFALARRAGFAVGVERMDEPAVRAECLALLARVEERAGGDVERALRDLAAALV